MDTFSYVVAVYFSSYNLFSVFILIYPGIRNTMSFYEGLLWL